MTTQFAFWILSFVSLALLFDCNAVNGTSNFVIQRSCTPMAGIKMCEPLGYDSITLPNPRGHVNKTEVSVELEDYKQLLDSGCSMYLRHFLCAYYAPMCEVFLPLDLNILPCTELCLHVRTRCEPLLESYGYTWPEHLECELFPNKTQAPWCFGPPNSSVINEDSTSSITPTATVAITTSSSTAVDEPITVSQTLSPSPYAPTAANKTCDDIPSDSICSNMEYTSVTYPNTLGHSTKEEAEDQLKSSFNIPMLYTCSEYLIPLLCHYYHPQCNNDTGIAIHIHPCRELCEEVTKKCSNSNTKQWPSNFNCSVLPSKKSNSNCTMGIALDITEELTPATPTIEGVERGGSAAVTSTITLISIFTFIAVMYLLKL